MTTATASAPVLTKRDRAKTIGLWALQIAGAAMFIMAGGPKLLGDPQAVQGFEVIGLGQWFRIFTGAIEVGSGILLLIPALAGVGAILLAFTMIGATLTHLFVMGGSPMAAIILFVVMSIIAYARRDRTLRLIGR